MPASGLLRREEGVDGVTEMILLMVSDECRHPCHSALGALL
jgi:hypothetical protein